MTWVTMIGIAGVVVAVGCALSLAGDGVRRPRQRAGLGTWADLKPALGYRAARKAASGRIAAVADDRDQARGKAVVFFGRLGRHDLFCQHEDSCLVFGQPRSGKTRHWGIRAVREAVGPTAVTSTKADIVGDTLTATVARGQVWMYDPGRVYRGEAAGVRAVKWDPVAGCEDPETALRRGAAWAAAQPVGNVKNGDWFNDRAAEVLSRLLHAAALGDELGPKDVLEVYEWTQDFSDPTPRVILEQRGPRGWAGELASLTGSRAGETVDSLKMSLSGVLGCLSSPRIMDSLTPGPGEQLDPSQFLSAANTVYLLTDKKQGKIIAPVFTMLIDELITTAAEMSQAAPGGFLWPPFRGVLDEVANIAPMPDLDAHMSDSGGRGIQLMPIVQSLPQMRKRWGPDGANAIKQAATLKLLLPGCDDSETMREMEDLAGRALVRRTSVSTGGGRAGTSTSTSQQWEPVLPRAEVPTIPVGTAWLRYRNLPPARIELPAMKDRHPSWPSRTRT